MGAASCGDSGGKGWDRDVKFNSKRSKPTVRCCPVELIRRIIPLHERSPEITRNVTRIHRQLQVALQTLSKRLLHLHVPQISVCSPTRGRIHAVHHAGPKITIRGRLLIARESGKQISTMVRLDGLSSAN